MGRVYLAHEESAGQLAAVKVLAAQLAQESGFLQRFQPSLIRRVKLYTKETPLFEQFGITDEINKALKSKVYLIFYQPYGMGTYKLWLPLDGRGVLLVGVGSSSGLAAGSRRVDIERCFEWRTVEQAISYSSAVLGTGAFSMQCMRRALSWHEPGRVCSRTSLWRSPRPIMYVTSS